MPVSHIVGLVLLGDGGADARMDNYHIHMFATAVLFCSGSVGVLLALRRTRSCSHEWERGQLAVGNPVTKETPLTADEATTSWLIFCEPLHDLIRRRGPYSALNLSRDKKTIVNTTGARYGHLMKTRRFRPKKTGFGFWSVIDVFTGDVVVLHDIEVAWLEGQGRGRRYG